MRLATKWQSCNAFYASECVVRDLSSTYLNILCASGPNNNSNSAFCVVVV